MGAPKVTVILPTYNRQDFLGDCISSVLAQTMTDFELLVINDGGPDVSSITEAFNDSRLIYLPNQENKGKAHCCNIGLNTARGQYIAYIDDDDVWYPNHLQVLAECLENNPHLDAAYTDLYRVGFFKDPDRARRCPIDKKIIVSRDFNRIVMLNSNHVLHVSLMHKKQAAVRVNGYDESLTALIDWNIARKLAFIGNFKHINIVTGEYYAPLQVTDRISHLQVTDPERYRLVSIQVKADLPPYPWPHFASVEAVLRPGSNSLDVEKYISGFMGTVQRPMRLMVVNNGTGRNAGLLEKITEGPADLKNVTVLTPDVGMSYLDVCRLAAEKSDADYLLMVDEKFDAGGFDVDEAAACLEKSDSQYLKLNGRKIDGVPCNFLAKRDQLLGDEYWYENKPVSAAGLKLSRIVDGLDADRALVRAQNFCDLGKFAEADKEMKAFRSFDRGRPTDQAVIDTITKICLGLGEPDRAISEVAALINKGYKPDNFIRLGRILLDQKKYAEGASAFKAGLQSLGIQPVDFESSVFPAALSPECDLFIALQGLGDCLHALGELQSADQMYLLAAKVDMSSPLPFIGCASNLVADGQLEKAEQFLAEAEVRKGAVLPGFHKLKGAIEEQKEDLIKARDCYVRAYKLDRNDPDVLTGLKRIEPDAQSDNSRALELAGDSPPKARPGRNSPCPCGSGKKYKKCCLNKG